MSLVDTPEYKEYHRRVVEACVALMGENTREFWNKQCTFEEEFAAKEPPSEVAFNQQDSL